MVWLCVELPTVWVLGCVAGACFVVFCVVGVMSFLVCDLAGGWCVWVFVYCRYCSSGTLDEFVGWLWFEWFWECGLWVLEIVACLVV